MHVLLFPVIQQQSAVLKMGPHVHTVPGEEVPDDGISYIVPADADTSASYGGTSGESLLDTQTYVLNTSTHKFHRPGCPSVDNIDPKNYSTYTGTREAVKNMGYSACGNCNP